MALVVLETINIPGGSRDSDWVFSQNIPAGANAGIKPIGSIPGTYGILGYASYVYQIAGQNVIYPSQPIPLFENTLSMVFASYVAAQPGTFNPYPGYMGIHLQPWIVGGQLQIIQDTTTVYLARF